MNNTDQDIAYGDNEERKQGAPGRRETNGCRKGGTGDFGPSTEKKKKAHDKGIKKPENPLKSARDNLISGKRFLHSLRRNRRWESC